MNIKSLVEKHAIIIEKKREIDRLEKEEVENERRQVEVANELKKVNNALYKLQSKQLSLIEKRTILTKGLDKNLFKLFGREIAIGAGVIIPLFIAFTVFSNPLIAAIGFPFIVVGGIVCFEKIEEKRKLYSKIQAISKTETIDSATRKIDILESQIRPVKERVEELYEKMDILELEKKSITNAKNNCKTEIDDNVNIILGICGTINEPTINEEKNIINKQLIKR